MPALHIRIKSHILSKNFPFVQTLFQEYMTKMWRDPSKSRCGCDINSLSISKWLGKETQRYFIKTALLI